MRLIRLSEAKAAMHMAIDEAILESKIDTLRFYMWMPPAVTIGFFQSINDEVDTEKAGELGIDVVRRQTGGGAVLHENELTYSLIAGERIAGYSVEESYKKICSAVMRGLEILGLDAEFSPINDILVNGKKISGNAQTRRGGFVLQHGTILLDVDVKKMFSLLRVPDEKIRDKIIKKVEERVTSLKKECGGYVKPEKVALCMRKGFREVLGENLEEGELKDSEYKRAEELAEKKYSSKEWNYWR